MTPIIECMKKGNFEWTLVANEAFEMIKQRLCETYILVLSDFDKLIEVECDASRVRIWAIFTQSKRHLAYFSEKLNDTKRRYSTSDK